MERKGLPIDIQLEFGKGGAAVAAEPAETAVEVKKKAARKAAAAKQTTP